MMLRFAGLMVSLVLVGCADTSPQADAPIDPERPWRQEGDVIDSIFPMEVMIARFREGVDSVATLQSRATGRDALARDFIAAVAAGDSTALTGMLVNRREFAWLIFADHIYARPPYELDPAIHWMQIQASSAKGLARVLERYGRRTLTFQSLNCDRDTVQFLTGPTVAWAPCTVTYTDSDSTLTRRLFGTIVERDGKAKFLGYANEF